MAEFAGKHAQCLGLVSSDIPLISNLDAGSNIALIRQYRRNLREKDARQMALDYLHRFGMANIADKRNPALTHKERFCVKLIRAVMVTDAVVVIDRPFQIIPNMQDAGFIREALKKVEDSYRESHIFDYRWNGPKYGVDDAEKS